MSATNYTTNYNLSQFIGTDKPAWLTDYNGDMSRIDAGIKAAADAATAAATTAGTADGKADTVAGQVTTLDTQINTPSTGLAAVVSGHTTDISGINSKIGTTVLPTTAQTVTGAIDEVCDEIGTTALPTTAQTLTGAIDEIYSSLQPGGNVSVAPENSETFAEMFNRLYALVDRTRLTRNSKIILTDPGDGGTEEYYLSRVYASSLAYTANHISSTSMNAKTIVLSSSSSYNQITAAAGGNTVGSLATGTANRNADLYY